MASLLGMPMVVFMLSFLALWPATLLGGLIASKIRPVQEIEREDINLTISASLTLLALIVGFSFSMALNRYDQRKNYEEEEANSIGTEYVRADLLPEPDAAQVRRLLRQFLRQRLVFYTTQEPDLLRQVGLETARLENELWASVRSDVALQPTPPMALVLSGMNDVLNRESYTQAAWWYSIPPGAWVMMGAISLVSCLLIGYGARGKGMFQIPVVPLLVAISFFSIADIDSPRHGIIRVVPQDLMRLAQSLQAQ